MAWSAPRNWNAGEFVTSAMMNAIRDQLNVLKTSLDNGGAFAPSPTTLTLLNNACTPTGNFHLIDTEGGASFDLLETLTIAGNIREGHILVIGCANVNHLIVVKKTGNIVMVPESDGMSIYHLDDFLTLILRGTTWYEIGRSNWRFGSLGLRHFEVPISIVAGKITFDLALGNHFVCTLNGNVTSIDGILNTVSNGQAVQFTVRFIGDGTGGRTINWGSFFKFPGGVTPTPTTTNGKSDVYQWLLDAGGATIWSLGVTQNM